MDIAVTTLEPTVATSDAIVTTLNSTTATSVPSTTMMDIAVTTLEPTVSTSDAIVTTLDSTTATSVPSTTMMDIAVTTLEPTVATSDAIVTTSDSTTATSVPLTTMMDIAVTTLEPTVSTSDAIVTTSDSTTATSVPSTMMMGIAVTNLDYTAADSEETSDEEVEDIRVELVALDGVQTTTNTLHTPDTPEMTTEAKGNGQDEAQLEGDVKGKQEKVSVKVEAVDGEKGESKMELLVTDEVLTTTNALHTPDIPEMATEAEKDGQEDVQNGGDVYRYNVGRQLLFDIE
ncbi:hypothetical protein TcWFU_010547 [Taenia crassiceps]|uniref:Uncharacterized protein n=1 Tax=Taenia crassiceps TaxID=6207 RepID=A0ABR4Q7K1_9CEST